MNRIDEVVIFNPLSRGNLRNIAAVMLAKIPIKVEADKKPWSSWSTPDTTRPGGPGP